MAEQPTHINYTFEDIQRYLQGKMSAAEMHGVEKAALQDPFLADAIEGYNEIPAATAGQHLNEINASLYRRQKKSKVVLFSPKTQWWRIAALIVVLAGVGIIGSYVFKKSNQNQDVAQLKKEETTKNVSPMVKDSLENKPASQGFSANEENNNYSASNDKSKRPPVPASTRKERANGLASDHNLKTEDADASILTAAPSVVNRNIQKDEEADKSKAVAPGIKAEKADSLHFDLSEKNNSPVITFSGKVVDENNQPVPDVIIQSADKKITTLSDVQGNFSMQKQDSTITVSAGAIGYESNNAELKAGNANRILLNQSNTALNDIVVVGYGVKKGDRAKNKDAAPVGGWENFNHYVQQQLNKDSTADYFEDEDLVKLEFSVDKSGNPYNFRFLQPQDAERNSKAIEILKQGPKWTSMSKNKKVRIGIAF